MRPEVEFRFVGGGHLFNKPEVQFRFVVKVRVAKGLGASEFLLVTGRRGAGMRNAGDW